MKKKRLNEVCNALLLLYTMQISFIFYLLIIFHHPSPYILLLLHSTKVFIINHQLIKVRKHAIPVNKLLSLIYNLCTYSFSFACHFTKTKMMTREYQWAHHHSLIH